MDYCYIRISALRKQKKFPPIQNLKLFSSNLPDHSAEQIHEILHYIKVFTEQKLSS